MGWQDRDYGRGDGGGGRSLGESLNRFFNWSLPIGTYLNVAVRVHILFLLFLAFELLGSKDAWWTLRWTSLLFVSVLLHEFGHVLGCRSVGGRANEILMWPLGGLAFCAPPQRPWPEFVTVICGPLVNVAIMAAAYAALLPTHGGDMPVGFNPLSPWRTPFAVPGVPGILADLFVVNYSLLLFNICMVFFPFDGGRLVQIALWKAMGHHRSMLIATRIGMAGAVAVAIYALSMRQSRLIFIAIFGFISCYQQGLMLRAGAFGDEPQWSAGVAGADRERKAGWFERRRMKAAARRAAAERDAEAKLDAEVDRILAKVKDQGLQSLTEKEKKTLHTATERQRRVG